MELDGYIFDIKRYAIHDGPGIRTTVFLKGCPLRCKWCHNPESWRNRPEPSVRPARCQRCGVCVQACPEHAIQWSMDRPATDLAVCLRCGNCLEVCPTGARQLLGRRVTAAEVLEEIERDVIFYDESGGGATFSGGEPLVQVEFLEACLEGCREREIPTALDTSCHAGWDVIERIRPLVDLFLCDLKHLDSARHEEYTGVANELILQNIRRLAKLGEEVTIRVPVVPGVNDGEEHVRATGEFVASLGGVQRVDLLPYHEGGRAKLEKLEDAGEPSLFDSPVRDRLEEIAGRLRGFDLEVRIGG